MIPAGLAFGALVGVASRAWMRLISSDPEFSWAGTLFIVAVFAFAGLTQGIALAVRTRGWRWWPQLPVRAVAAFAALLLGGGAGIVMLPAIVTGALATARTDWPRALRVVVAGIATVNALALLWLLGTEPLGWRCPVGWLTMLPLYAVIIGGVSLNLRPLAGGPVLRRRSTAVAAAAVVGGGILALALVGA
jgi:hypothetical protein